MLLPKQPVFFQRSPNQPLFVFGNFGVKDFKHNLLDLLPLVCECGTGLYDKCREENCPLHICESRLPFISISVAVTAYDAICESFSAK